MKIKPGRVWMRKSDSQLGEAFTGCMGWIWFYNQVNETAVISETTPCIFINDKLEKHGLHTPDMFEDLGPL